MASEQHGVTDGKSLGQAGKRPNCVGYLESTKPRAARKASRQDPIMDVFISWTNWHEEK